MSPECWKMAHWSRIKVMGHDSLSDCFLNKAQCILACLIKPKSQIGLSYPPNLVHILILLGFAKKIKIPSCTGS